MTEITTEHLILSGLCLDETFTRQVSSYIKEEYFHDEIELGVYKLISNYFEKYNALPNKTVLLHELSQNDNEDYVRVGKSLINNVFSIERPSNREWLLEQAETFCREKATYNSVLKAISIFDGSDTSLTSNGAIELLNQSVSISFDTKIGQDIFEDATELFQLYINKEEKIAFNLDILNTITNNGVGLRTLNMLLSPFGGGKTLAMVHLASDYIRLGYNVLYCTMEMSESEISKRIHSNILNIGLNDYENIGLEKFTNRIENLKSKSYGKLKVKAYPTGVGNVNHIKNTLQELKTKKDFVPNVIFCDYLGIMGSIHLKAGNVNSNSYLKSISEELRALAFTTNTAIWTAGQLNRNSLNDTDVDYTGIAESIGIIGILDSLFAIIRTEEMDSINQLMIKQLKNRYANKIENTRFILGVDLEKQQWFSCNEDTQTDNIINEKDLFKTSTNNTRNKFSNLDDNN